eukprot:g364.t1
MNYLQHLFASLSLLALLQVNFVYGYENFPKCQANGPSEKVTYVGDGTYRRCYTTYSPPVKAVKNSTNRTLRGNISKPILFWFHGAGGNAMECGMEQDTDRGFTLQDYADRYGFHLICAEALQNKWGDGGRWAIPDKQSNRTGPVCQIETEEKRKMIHGNQLDLIYVRNIIATLDPKVFDTSRIFTAGHSMGSGFSFYIATCMHKWFSDDQRIFAFATHATGLKTKGDNLAFPPSNYGNYSWGECDDKDCEYFPTVPVPSKKLKACIFDNFEDPSAKDPFFFKSSKVLEETWQQLGNPVQSHYAHGGHNTIHSFDAIIQCLNDNPGNVPLIAGSGIEIYEWLLVICLAIGGSCVMILLLSLGTRRCNAGECCEEGCCSNCSQCGSIFAACCSCFNRDSSSSDDSGHFTELPYGRPYLEHD